MINTISLFAGCGGMDFGFHRSGFFNLIWANDFDANACQTYKTNIGEHIVCGDINQINIDSIPVADLVIGGFPCQDFSMASKRKGIDAQRGNLYLRFVEIVAKKRPKMFIAENVQGILTANKGEAVKKIAADFADAGYAVRTHLVNFSDYGVAQNRKRVFFVGVRRDIDRAFEIPRPTTPDHIGAKAALKNVELAIHNNQHHKISQATREKLKLIPAGGNFNDIPKDSPHRVKGMLSMIYRRLHPDKPSSTIIAGGGGGTLGYHYEQHRPLTNRERARLFGYPDDFIFCGSLSDVRRQIGNSVPPEGVRPLADQVAQFITNLDL